MYVIMFLRVLKGYRYTRIRFIERLLDYRLEISTFCPRHGHISSFPPPYFPDGRLRRDAPRLSLTAFRFN